MANKHFYPSIEPFETGILEVSEPHRLYWEQCGNPDGDPILFLHGGPGAGCTEYDRCFFDPEYFRNVNPEPDSLLLDRVERIRHIPAFAVHGRYDIVCSVKNLTDLAQAWPELDHVIAPDSGHSSHEPGITRELVAATDRIVKTGSPGYSGSVRA